MPNEHDDQNSADVTEDNRRGDSKDQALKRDTVHKTSTEALKGTYTEKVSKLPAGMAAPSGQFAYDVEAVEDFIATVFHDVAENDEREKILLYLANATKSAEPHKHLPIHEKQFFQNLRASRSPATLYMSTATSKPDESGKLRNLKALFQRLHVLVLDDIGTKVSRDLFTIEHAPSYVLETSPGNYQYGYVLEKPLANHAHAAALVQAVYGSGYSDEGGALATKKVRVPQGAHGKKDSPHFYFRSELHSLNDRRFTPEQLIKLFKVEQNWKTLKAEAERGIKHSPVGPATRYNQKTDGFSTAHGYEDPIVDALDKMGLIIEDGDSEWLTIQCPWHNEHSDGNPLAGYSPIGCGPGAYKHRRGFNCFHSHGGDRDTAEFLAWVAERSEDDNVIGAPVYDPAAEMVHNYVWSAAGHVWDLQGQKPFCYEKKQHFDDSFNQRVPYLAPNAKGMLIKKFTTKAKCFHQHPQRVMVRGATFDPRTKSSLIEDEEGKLHVNTFTLPDYGNADPAPQHFARFKEYIEYLLPNPEESANFLDFLAAKLQDPSFRGWGWVMITKANGTGRGTLALMLNTLFGGYNCDSLPFDELLEPSNFNEWQRALIVTTNEAHDPGAFREHEARKVSERLKQIIDTTSTAITINPKYGAKLHNCVLATSHIVFSNNLVSLIKDDQRRMYYVRNPLKPASVEFFSTVRKWMDAKDKRGVPKWRDSVANTLLARTVDLAKLNGPAPRTCLHDAADEASPNALSLMIKTFAETINSPFYPAHLANKAVLETASQYDLVGGRNPQQLIRNEITAHTSATPISVWTDGNTRRVRYFTSAYPEDEMLLKLQRILIKPNAKVPDTIKNEIGAICKEQDVVALKSALERALKEEGYI